jgi:hypothetical protein
LIHSGDVEPAELRRYESEQAAGTVEEASHACGREACPIARLIDVKTSVKIFSKGPGHLRIVEGVEVDSDVAASGVLTKNCRTEIPTRVIVAGEIGAFEARPERRGRQHRPIVERRCRNWVLLDDGHAEASGGR